MTVEATNALDPTEVAAMTVRECAAAVINAGKIDLNCKLGVFKVVGTSEHRSSEQKFPVGTFAPRNEMYNVSTDINA